MTEMTERPLVTFAVIAYNQESFIREAIEGAFAQTYQPLEIVLSDDGSSDRTYQIMQEMVAAYDGPHRVRLHRNEPNLGLVPHIDRVMELVRGEFIVVSAGDDVSLPERTSAMVAVWKPAKGEVSMVHSPAEKIDENGRSLGLRISPQPVLDSPSAYTLAAGCHYVLGATVGWDRRVFDKFGPLGAGLDAEDHVIPFRAALLGRIEYIDKPLIKYRTGGMSLGQYRGEHLYNYLYGSRHTLRKWHSQADIYIVERFNDVDYPRKKEAEAICRERGEIMRFSVDLVESSKGVRWLMVPRAVRLALRYRNVRPLKDWARYTFEVIYLPYANWRMSRRDKLQSHAPDTKA
ncbi:glycosyltransferase [Roseovarius sp. D22-M7]|uniref:glycosyltransferase n=1 Tax=Roseovarius sp. D22-M7 TaxID=3127116 RepID=UPI00300FB6F0